MKISLYGLIADQTIQEKTKISEIEIMAIRTTNMKYRKEKMAKKMIREFE